MSTGRRIFLAFLTLVALGLFAIVWMSRHSFHREPVIEDVGLKGEALENQTLLLQKWLEAGGHSVTRKGGELLAKELPENGLLILLHLSQPITPGEVETLRAWVSRGGHLVTDGTAAPFNDERGLAALHKALGVTLKNTGSSKLDFLSDSKYLSKDTFQDDEVPYRVRRSANWRLIPDRPEIWTFRMGYDKVFVLLSRKEGLGRITLTPDLNFVYRESLAGMDHAAYFQRVLALHPGQGPAVVWSRPVEMSLFLWLRNHAMAPSLALLALVFAWVWKGWPRFGPVLPEMPPQRRSLLEHLSASARLIWWSGAGASLVARTRASLEKRAQRLNPAYASLGLGDRAAWLAQTAGGDPDAIAAALDDRPGRTNQLLAQDLITLEKLRQRL